MRNVYFDNSATTKLDELVLKEMMPYFTNEYGNASSIYKIGRNTRCAISMSAHKLYGPKGIGVLYVKKGVRFEKFMNGGHQERNKRAGTENVPAIVGLGKAIELAYENFEEHNSKIKELRDYYVKEVQKRIPYIKINGDMEKRLPGNSNISFRFIEGEGLLLNLDLKGIYASSGSACTSGSLDPSHVLLAIGLPHEIAHGTI